MNIRDINRYVSERVLERYTYYDQISLWLDTQAEIFDEKICQLIAAEGSTIRLSKKPMSKYHPSFRQRVVVEQVSQATLQIIDDALLAAGCGYLINRIELTIDRVCASAQGARELQGLIEQGFIHDNGKQQFYCSNYVSDAAASMGTYYFADKEKHKIIPVLYSDRRKPLSGNQPCAHFEYRLCKTDICKRKGFHVIQDLLDCNVMQYMKNNMTFVKKPTQVEVGKAVPGVPIGSTSGLKKRCNEYLYNQDKTFADTTAQELLSYFPTLRSGVMAKSKDYHQAMLRALLG